MSGSLKVSLPGHDTDSGDINLAFSSSWPGLRIISGKEIVVTGNTMTEIPHERKFVPLVISWNTDVGSAGLVDAIDMQRLNLFVDSEKIYLSHTNSTFSFFLMAFDIDLETAYEAPKLNQSTSSNATSVGGPGIRFSKRNKDVSSDDMRDYIFHSSARSPLLHAVAPLVANSAGEASYTHTLPYNPIFFVFGQRSIAGINGTPYQLMNNFAGVSTSGNTISLTGLTAGYKASVVVLKDPFYIDSNVKDITI